MICNCGRVGEIGSEHLCSFCFIERFEKRVKKALRQRKLEKNERVLVVGEVAAYLFNKYIRVPLFVEYSSELKEWFDAVIIEWTMDDECIAFLEAFAGGKLKDDSSIKLFQFVSDQDVGLYAKMKNLNFIPRKKSMHWQEFLSRFDLDMKYNLLRSAGEFRELMRKPNKN